jgi:uncharacterized delta-60 repeat protein
MRQNTAPTFAAGDGIVTTPAMYGQFEDVAITGDGRILAGGGYGDFVVGRYLPSGALDTSFGGSGLVGVAMTSSFDTGRVLVTQPDGKLLIAGDCGYDAFGVLRLDASGATDATFGTGGVVTTHLGAGYQFATAMAVQGDGKILVTGYMLGAGGNYDLMLVRYNTDGSLDASFGTGGAVIMDVTPGADDHAASIQLLANGRFLVVGDSNFDIALLRFNANGQLDTSFGTGGKVFTDFGATEQACATTLLANGKIVVAGSTSGPDYRFAVGQYNADGSLDTGFNGTGKTTIDFGGEDLATAMKVLADGRIVVVGSTGTGTSADFAIGCLNADGSIDTTFDGDGRQTVNPGDFDMCLGVAEQADGKLVLAGTSATLSNGTRSYELARLTGSGSLDTSFDAPANGLDGFAQFTEKGSPVVLDGNVEIDDAELTPLDDFGGASITLVRHGGANAEDIFSATGNLVLKSNVVLLSDTEIGSYVDSGGSLTITFNAKSPRVVVNEVLSSLAYSNNSEAPPPGVQIDWIFNDGNAGAQGSGGAMAGTGSTWVQITSVVDVFTGTAAGDNLTGTAGEDDISGLDGNDQLSGLAGNDSIAGGLGNDTILGGLGNDTLAGGDQADSLSGGDGNDLMAAGKGLDYLDGGAGNDTLTGGIGNDTLIGGDGSDAASYATSSDAVTVNLATGVGGSTAPATSVGSGTDSLTGIENVIGSAFNDVLAGDGNANRLDGGDGNDNLAGGLKADTLIGGAGDDTLAGGQGMDSLDGGDGNDLLKGALGTDILTGGAGADHFQFASALDGVLNIDRIVDFTSGTDVIELSASVFTAFAGQVGNTVGLGANLTYDPATGVLAYDGDGTGAGAAVTFAILGGLSHPATIGADFLIV